VSLSDRVRPALVRKIREAPSEEEAIKIYQLARDLEHRLSDIFPSSEVIKSLLEELKIESGVKNEILDALALYARHR